jgi:hypothetical protein
VKVVAGALDHCGPGGLRQVERQRMAAPDGGGLTGGLADDVGEVDDARALAPVGVGARQQQQVAHEAAHPLRRAQRRVGDVGGSGAVAGPARAAQLVLEQLQVGEDARQRRPQLVRGVRHELALALQGRLGLAARRRELGEHLAQRRRQLGYLVVRHWSRQHRTGGIARAGHLAGGLGQARDRPHRAARDEEARQEGEDRADQDAER